MSIIINVLYNNKSYTMADKRSVDEITNEAVREDSNKLIILFDKFTHTARVCIGKVGSVRSHHMIVNAVDPLLRNSELPFNATTINDLFFQAMKSLEFNKGDDFSFLFTGRNSDNVMVTYKIIYTNGVYDTSINTIIEQPNAVKYTIFSPPDIDKNTVKPLFSKIMNHYRSNSTNDDWLLKSMQELIDVLSTKSKVINSKTDHCILS